MMTIRLIQPLPDRPPEGCSAAGGGGARLSDSLKPNSPAYASASRSTPTTSPAA